MKRTYFKDDEPIAPREPEPTSTFEIDPKRQCGVEDDPKSMMPWRCTRRRGHPTKKHHAHDNQGMKMHEWEA